MTAGGMSVTPERSESVRFLEPLISSGMAAIVRDDGASAAGSGSGTVELSFWAGMKRSFERNLIEENRWRMILVGVQETIIISLASLVLGTALGAGICVMRRSENPVPRHTAAFFIRALQGTPIVVLLMIFYYIILAKVQVSGTAVAVIAFSCNFVVGYTGGDAA